MSQYQDNIAVLAGADLSSSQYKAVAYAGTIAASNSAAAGILQNKPESGEDGTLTIVGRTFIRAGGAISAGGLIMVTTSGWLTAVVSGSLPCGRAFEAITSGSIGEAYVNFATAKTDVSA